jgi:Carboxypeptidase regulatory-like domain
MKARPVAIKFVCSLLVCLAALLVCASASLAQTSETGALTGTVTDPSGAVISGATVIATNVGTGQSRTTTTDSNGSYKLSLLPPGNYSVKFSAAGFKTSEVPSVAVNVTETPVLNRSLSVGAQSEQITVESTAETIQTQNATNGGVVGSQEVTDLPLVSRNYTQVITLSPGVVANVSSAAGVGNGTGDVAANGSRQNQNNYSMDGSSIVNYVSGTAGQTGSYPGIAIPNPDSIQEFKVQTSQYDASSGRNPGANVTVVTKSGTNQFHGAAWEFNRNNFFNANDFFYKASEEAHDQPNRPQTLKQNTFGGTFGGPIKKDKLFFFGSYQGLRQVNGIGTSGFASGYEPNTILMPWNDYGDLGGACSDLRCTNNVAAYRAYLGSVFNGNTGADGVAVTPSGSTISNTAIALLQAKGLIKGGYNQGFYFPSAPASCGTSPNGCLTAISDPTVANENQYMINTDYVISSKHTLSEKYFLSEDPQNQSFNCFITAGNCNPGAPVNADYVNHVGELKLTSVLTSSLVNEARFSFHRDVENNTDPNNVDSCSISSTAYIIPMVNNGVPCPLTTGPPFGALAKRFPEFNVVPILDITGDSGGPPWSQGGNFSMISSNFINTFQWGDQVSWNHGKHALRFGFEGERILYNNTIPSSGRGELLIGSTADFLTSSVGPLGNPYDPGYSDGTAAAALGGISFGFGLQGALTHYNRVNAFDWYVQDDVKVSRKLTVNLGLRWEYDGFPDDKSGQFANVWASQAAKINTGSYFLANPGGTLVGFVVPSNFDVKDFGLTAPDGATGVLVNSNKTLVPGTPLHNFAPRLGLAWQPLNDKFVVRAGYGWFYDRIYGNLLIDNQLNLPPYSGAGFGGFPADLSATLHDPWFAGARQPTPLVWTPRTLTSGFGYTSDSPEMANRLPLTYEYNLDLQYEFAHGWVADLGYVGTHSIHLYNWSQDINVAQLVAGAPNNPTAASGHQNSEMIASSLPYNDPANTTPQTTNVTNCFPCGIFSNANDRVSYLGFGPAGLATTSTNGDALYNSLQAELRHQFSHGLLLQVSYTWSQGLTNVNTAQAGSGINPPGEVLYGSSNSNDPLDLRQQYALSAFNRPQRAVISYVYDLPWKHEEGFTGKMLSGWSISGVTTIQSGLPFTVIDSQGETIYGAGTSTAALAHPGVCSAATGNCRSAVSLISPGSTTQRAETNWLNPAAFTSMCTVSAFTGALPSSCTTPLPADSPYCIGGIPNAGGSPTAPCGSIGSTFPGAGTGYGNSEVGAISGPGQFNWDMAILKSTKIWEHGTLQFRAEFFNIWNHPQFDPPFGNDVSTPSTFGKITSTSNTPRVIQFGLKYLF